MSGVTALRREAGIAWISMNRPESMNAINSEMRQSLPAMFGDADNDPDVSVIVVTGEGCKGFCAGADLKEGWRSDRGLAERHARQVNGSWMSGIANCRKPTIAAVHGYCLGGGLEIALCCDLRVASADARFGFPEVTRGVLPGGGGTQRLPRVVGLGNALDMILTGELLTAEQALRIGLVTRVVPPEGLVAEATRVAQMLAKNSATAVELAKELVWRTTEVTLDQGLKLENDLFNLAVAHRQPKGS